jgi:hypothetical protein
VCVNLHVIFLWMWWLKDKTRRLSCPPFGSTWILWSFLVNFCSVWLFRTLVWSNFGHFLLCVACFFSCFILQVDWCFNCRLSSKRNLNIHLSSKCYYYWSETPFESSNPHKVDALERNKTHESFHMKPIEILGGQSTLFLKLPTYVIWRIKNNPSIYV